MTHTNPTPGVVVSIVRDDGGKNTIYISQKGSEGLKVSPLQVKIKDHETNGINEFLPADNGISNLAAIQYQKNDAKYIAIAQYRHVHENFGNKSTIKEVKIYSAIFVKSKTCYQVVKIMAPKTLPKTNVTSGTLQLGHTFDGKTGRLFMFYYSDLEFKELYYTSSDTSIAQPNWLNGPYISLKFPRLLPNGIIVGTETVFPGKITGHCKQCMQMVDLCKVEENRHEIFGPYTLSKPGANSKIINVANIEKAESSQPLTVTVSVKNTEIVYSDNTTNGFELDHGGQYKFIGNMDEFKLKGRDFMDKDVLMGFDHIFTAFPPSSRLRLPRLINLADWTENFEIIRMNDGNYFAAYSQQSTLYVGIYNAESKTPIKHVSVKQNIMSTFGAAGEVVSVGIHNGSYYVLTTKTNESEVFDTHTVWSFIHKDNTLKVSRGKSLRTLKKTGYLKVFLEFYVANEAAFTKQSHNDVNIGVIFDKNRFYTNTSAGDNASTNRLSDAFCGEKAHYFEDWASYHANLCIPVIDAPEHTGTPVYVL